MADTYYDAQGNPIQSTQYRDYAGNVVNTKSIITKPQPATPGVGAPSQSDMASGGLDFLRSMLPVAGTAFGPEGTMAGSFAKMALDPATQSFSDVGKTAATDLTLNQIIPGVLKGIVGIPGALRAAEEARISGNIKGLQDLQGQPPTPEEPTVQRTLTHIPGKYVVGKPGQPSVPGVPGVLNLREGKFGEGLDSTPGDYNEYYPPLAPQIGVPPQPGHYEPDTYEHGISVSAVNPARNIELQGQKELTNLINKGFSPSAKTIEPDKILDELYKNPDSYANVDPIKREGLKEFLGGIKEQQSLTPALTKDSIMRYAQHRLYFGLGEGMLGGTLASIGHPLAGASLILTGESIGALTANPEIARVAAKAFTTGFSAPESSLVSKILLYTLRGTGATLMQPDGKKEKVMIDDKGNITYAKPNSQ